MRRIFSSRPTSAASESPPKAVATCGCNVKVLPADGEEAKRRGVDCAPCVWKDGERVFCGTPTMEEAIAKLRVSA